MVTDPDSSLQKQIVREAYNSCAKDYAAARDQFHSQRWLDELLASLPEQKRFDKMAASNETLLDEALALAKSAHNPWFAA